MPRQLNTALVFNMNVCRKIVLHITSADISELDSVIERFMSEGIIFVGVVGPGASDVEDLIDEIAVGDGTREPYSLLTSSHEGSTVEEALAFADLLTKEFSGPSRVVGI